MPILFIYARFFLEIFNEPLNKTHIMFKADKSISILISIILLSIYASYSSSTFQNLPCDGTLLSKCTANFVHTNAIHLLSNLIGFYFLSEIKVMEERINAIPDDKTNKLYI